MTDHVAVLFANEAFYAAFANGDFAAMDEVWARDVPVSCIHPGWNAIAGRDAVMKSWRGILGSANTSAIRCRHPNAWLFGEFAYVLCHEELASTFLIATNIFVSQRGIWRMVHHQAAAAPPPGEDDEPETPDVLQ